MHAAKNIRNENGHSQAHVRVRIHDIRPRSSQRTSQANTDGEKSNLNQLRTEDAVVPGADAIDEKRRTFLKTVGGVGLGVVAASLIPRSADALIMGGTPSTSVVGVKDASNIRVNPATDDTLADILTGLGVLKKTTVLSSSGTVHTPASGKKIRVYANRFSLSDNAASVSFRFTAGGSDYEKYSTPKAGGLYGANNHPNYIEGAVDQALYCVISGTTTVQINIDYLEI